MRGEELEADLEDEQRKQSVQEEPGQAAEEKLKADLDDEQGDQSVQDEAEQPAAEMPAAGEYQEESARQAKPGAERGKVHSKKKQNKEDEETVFLEQAILAAERDHRALEKAVVRHVLAEEKTGPCGHVLKVASCLEAHGSRCCICEKEDASIAFVCVEGAVCGFGCCRVCLCTAFKEEVTFQTKADEKYKGKAMGKGLPD